MRKIKVDGPYAGKNKTKFDSDGKAIKKTEFDSDYMQALRQGEGKNADGSAMLIEDDKKVKRRAGQQEEHFKKVK